MDEPIVLIGTLPFIAPSIEISSICFSLMWLFCVFKKIMELFEREDGSRYTVLFSTEEVYRCSVIFATD